MGEMTWEEVRDAIADDYGVLLTVGSTEQHGPHLPLSTDTILPLAVARGVAERTRTLIATPLYYGYKSKPLSGGGQGFPGTTSLRGTTLIALVHDVVSELLRSGFRKLTVMNWHMENVNFVYEGVDLAMREGRDSGARVISMDSPFKTVGDKALAPLFPEDFPGHDVEHASLIETSLMLFLHPELVRQDRTVDDQAERHPPYDMIPAPADTIPKSGVLYRATLGTREKGQQLYEMLVDGVSSAIRREFGG
jgi:creatinine amidohydrolase